MAASLRSNLSFLMPHSSSTTQPNITRSYTSIRCGPRDNRGPLIKGRVLSTEAIQAVQALKRAHRADPTNLRNNTHLSETLSRLIKADLIAAFKELLRQDQGEIALRVFSAVRSEYNLELGLYADLITALGRKRMVEEIEGVVCELEKVGRIQCDDKGLVRLVRALIDADCGESTVRIYGLMKRSGWGSTFEVDEYVAKVLSKGLRRFGEERLANEVDVELRRSYSYKSVMEKARI
ncbi:hypothetical protein ACH5RR_008046 [Cinchona calisaya]|uniref:Uncharacterized protein n=1 Tax=Cinchona calisaya TaxID=153742 RepID=A0ABD3AC13_9GENT